ncbi:MAG: glutathione S-transferase N-terminal domain-containing protein [Pseudomonadota bacterium]
MAENAKNLEGLILYYSPFCYFCQKVMFFMRNQQIELEMRNTGETNAARELIKGGGKSQVPCLFVPSGHKANADSSSDLWLYESDDIIDFLKA